jgi:hypothetical protein
MIDICVLFKLFVCLFVDTMLTLVSRDTEKCLLKCLVARCVQ